MSRRLCVLPSADADVDAAAGYIAMDSVDAATRFLDAVDETYRDLRDHPRRWPVYGLSDPRLKDVRKRAVIGFRNYLVFYRAKGSVVEVIRVLHGARDLPSVLSDTT